MTTLKTTIAIDWKGSLPQRDLCVDESFSRRYNLVGDWINLGLTQYVHMDSNKDSG